MPRANKNRHEARGNSRTCSNRSITSLRSNRLKSELRSKTQGQKSVRRLRVIDAVTWTGFSRRRSAFVLCGLDYVVTSNHVHLLVKDTGPNVIAESMQLIAGRTAQE